MKNIVVKIEKYLQEDKASKGELEYFYFHQSRYEYLLKLLVGFNKEAKILDIGSAYLHLLMGLKELGFNKLYGADKGGLGVSTKRSKDFNIKINKIDLVEKVFFDDNFFDIIIFTEVLEHLNFYPGPMFKEFNRILRPGGKFILTTPNLTRLNNRIKFLIGKSIHPNIHYDYSISPHIREYTASELKYLTEQAGMQVEKIIYVDFHYPSDLKFVLLTNRLLGWILPWLRGNIVLIGEKRRCLYLE